MDHQGAIDSMSTSYKIFVCGVEGAISYEHIVWRYWVLWYQYTNFNSLNTDKSFQYFKFGA